MHQPPEEAEGRFLCQFKDCQSGPFTSSKELESHHSDHHDVGLELRMIILAAKASKENPFPQIGLQCPYSDCDESRFFDSAQSVMSHLEQDHGPRLREVMRQHPTSIPTIIGAVKWVMTVHDVPLRFDDHVIYCCPFTKNKVCGSNCFVDDANLLMEHLRSFHAVHSDDAQFIVNVLRFIELKPVWRRWRRQIFRERRQRRLEAVLKYRGNVRRGFVKQYLAHYNRKYEGHLGSAPSKERERDVAESERASVLMNRKLFLEFRDSDGVGIDEQVFEQVMARAIAAKYGHNDFLPDEAE